VYCKQASFFEHSSQVDEILRLIMEEQKMLKQLMLKQSKELGKLKKKIG
jgi:hypothetical protein